MATKQCRECGEVKNLSEFYKHQQMADGRLNKCKTCVKIRVRRHRKQNIDYLLEYDRKRNQLPHRIENRKAYSETQAGKEAAQRSRKKWESLNPHKKNASIAVNNAIKLGKLTKQPCEVCRSTERIHAHHDDYSKPLEVRWLCPKHHSEWHKHNEPIGA